MKATDKLIHEFLFQPQTQFLIPIYQRNYVWEIEQCEQLFNDILEASQENVSSHFIGSIFYNQESSAETNIKQLSVIDGQQRLTTITLVYIALYRLLIQKGDDTLARQIYEMYLINKFDKDQEKLKLRNTGNSVATLRFLLRENTGEELREHSQLYKNFIFLRGKVNENNYDAILRGLTKLTYVDMFIEKEKDCPQRIYESMNSTGKNLGEGDKIMNACLMSVSEREQHRLYLNYWEPIEDLLVKRCADGCENKIDDFLRDFIIAENSHIQKRKEIYSYFKRFLLKEGNTKILVAKLKRYANYYRKLVYPEYEADLDIRLQLEYINRLELNVSYPFLLKLYDDYFSKKLTKSTFIKLLELLQSYVIRRFLVNIVASLNYTFANLYDFIKDKPDYYLALAVNLLQRKDKSRFPKDEEIEAALKKKNFYKRSIPKRDYILERLENYRNREIVSLYNNRQITVEHIFPQNPNSTWKECLNEKEFEAMLEFKDSIANLTLSGNNGDLGNKSFMEKKCMNIEGKEQGYLHSRLWLNSGLKKYDRWGLEEFNDRLTIIYQRFVQVWEYPEVQLPHESEELEVRIIESDIRHYKNLAYAVIQGEKVRVRSIHDIYSHTIRGFFNANMEVFLNSESALTFHISKNSDEFKRAIKLSDKYYAEGCYGRKVKLGKIKSLLKLFKDEEALVKRENTIRSKSEQLDLFAVN
jgi:uncharacterized protein with ParB-like and HNH nuclease domain